MARKERSAAPARSVAKPPRSTAKPARKARKPLKSLVILSVVAGLIVSVALPAYGVWRPDAEAMTLQQVAESGAQTLVVASEADSVELERDTYSATTPAEIKKKKAAAAAAARARLGAGVAAVLVDVKMVSPGSGEVRWPILSFKKGRGFGDSGYHQGVDLLAPKGTPIYAAAAGVVRVSQESFGGYGVCITIDHVIAGKKVSTLYGHMTYGSRQVSSGQRVEAGQLIGLVGSTGSSTANHLHFEVHLNGTAIDPWAWITANAG